MGRILDALRNAPSRAPAASSHGTKSFNQFAKAPAHQTEPESDIPFIEVGGPREHPNQSPVVPSPQAPRPSLPRMQIDNAVPLGPTASGTVQNGVTAHTVLVAYRPHTPDSAATIVDTSNFPPEIVAYHHPHHH